MAAAWLHAVLIAALVYTMGISCDAMSECIILYGLSSYFI